MYEMRSNPLASGVKRPFDFGINLQFQQISYLQVVWNFYIPVAAAHCKIHINFL
jgi:hypothetical protein